METWATHVCAQAANHNGIPLHRTASGGGHANSHSQYCVPKPYPRTALNRHHTPPSQTRTPEGFPNPHRQSSTLTRGRPFYFDHLASMCVSSVTSHGFGVPETRRLRCLHKQTATDEGLCIRFLTHARPPGGARGWSAVGRPAGARGLKRAHGGPREAPRSPKTPGKRPQEASSRLQRGRMKGDRLPQNVTSQLARRL